MPPKTTTTVTATTPKELQLPRSAASPLFPRNLDPGKPRRKSHSAPFLALLVPPRPISEWAHMPRLLLQPGAELQINQFKLYIIINISAATSFPSTQPRVP